MDHTKHPSERWWFLFVTPGEQSKTQNKCNAEVYERNLEILSTTSALPQQNTKIIKVLICFLLCVWLPFLSTHTPGGIHLIIYYMSWSSPEENSRQSSFLPSLALWWPYTEACFTYMKFKPINMGSNHWIHLIATNNIWKPKMQGRCFLNINTIKWLSKEQH